MNDNPNRNEDGPASAKPTSWFKRRGSKAMYTVAILMTGAIAGSFATKAFSHGGPGFMRGHGPMGFMRGPANPAKMEKRAERMAKHLSVAVDATPEQSKKLVVIAKSLARDMAPLRSELQTARQTAVDLLVSPDMDPTTLEKLRTDQLTRWDSASKRILQAVSEASETLTPQQRTQLHERVKSWREARHGWGHGWKHRGSHHGRGHHGSHNEESSQ